MTTPFTGGVQKPRARRVCGDWLRVAGGPREHRLANRAPADQFHRAMDLGVRAAIVCYAKGTAARVRRRDHPFRLGQVHRHGFFAQDVPLGGQPIISFNLILSSALVTLRSPCLLFFSLRLSASDRGFDLVQP